MKKTALLLAFSLSSVAVQAADLMQVFQNAEQHDAHYAAARASVAAGREKTVQGRAGLLPVLTGSAQSLWNDNEARFSAPPGRSDSDFNSSGWTLTLTQPLFRWQNWVQYEQSKIQVAQAELQFAQARQDLLLRVAQAYFDVLAAEDVLLAVDATAKAISRQLEQARRNFEVGVATITDTHEAQARADLVRAQRVAAQNELDVRRYALSLLTGKDVDALRRLLPDIDMPAPMPAAMADWVVAAERDAIPVRQQEAVAELARREIERVRAAHYPTVDLVANHGYSRTLASAALGVAQTDFSNIGVQVALPLYQGGRVASQAREAAHQHEAARSGVDAARRNAAQGARQAYLGVVSGLSQISALRAALASSETALESNRLGYEVGVRINIDVLNAEQQVYAARRDLSKARFDVLMASLRLKAATGALDVATLQQVNALLAQ